MVESAALFEAASSKLLVGFGDTEIKSKQGQSMARISEMSPKSGVMANPKTVDQIVSNAIVRA